MCATAKDKGQDDRLHVNILYKSLWLRNTVKKRVLLNSYNYTV